MKHAGETECPRRAPSFRGGSTAVWLAILVALAPSETCADTANHQTVHVASLSAVWAYSPTRNGDDRNGAHFWAISALGNTTNHWSVRGQVMHGRYADYPQVGFASFTPVGLGLRYRLGHGRIGPYLELLSDLVFADWGGNRQVVIGLETGGGVTVRTTFATDVEVGLSYLRSGGTFERVYDAPSYDIDGLDQLVVRVAASLRFHHRPQE